MRFLGFGGKMCFSVLAEKCGFTGLAESVFLWKCVFYVFCKKTHFAVLAGKCVFQFLRENVFFGFCRKLCMQKNRIYDLKIIF